MTYLPRIADKELIDKLASTGAVVIEGPKACGKTETARQIAASEVLLDVDAIVETGDGRWAAFEIKLGPGLIDDGVANLLKFTDRIDTRKCGSPVLLGVIVGTGYGYMRKDGVAVIPVGALGP